jgi:hypothetical protein
MHKEPKNGFAGNYFFKPMTNSEHMPHSPTPTYADIECRQQSIFLYQRLEVLIGTINQGGLRHLTYMALSGGGLPDVVSQEWDLIRASTFSS